MHKLTSLLSSNAIVNTLRSASCWRHTDSASVVASKRKTKPKINVGTN